MAEDSSTQISNNTIVIEVPEHVITGQTLTLVAQVRENEYNEPVKDAKVIFFIKTSFFINGLVEIGEAITDEEGFASIDYVPNQPGDLQVVASYKSDSNSKPVVAENLVIVSGETEPFYQTVIGIEFPNSFIVWIITIVIIICAVWGTFLYIIYRVMVVHISSGTGTRGASLILFISVAILFIIVLLVIVTPETQYNFGLLP
ncbi:MAG: hypothetical protein MUP02_03655 [Actinobacteria bacterium]|nr:hypothetical protein [Actinomycetota bacterium]